MNLLFSMTILTVGLLILVGGFVRYMDQAQQVETVTVERGDLELLIRVTGEVINDRSVTLTALVDGQVNRVATAMGERVEANQVLASMDNRAAAARLQRAEAYMQQEAVRRREEQLRYQRLKKLADKGAVSQEKLEEAKLNWEAATAAWQVAKADLHLAEVAQEWQQIRAPFAAVVVGKSTEVGQWVEAGTKLFSLVALDQWEIEAHVDAVDSGRVKLGQPVTIRCDAFPGLVWQSTLSWIGPSVEREKDKRLNTFRVRLGLGETPPPLLLGQQLDLEILVDHRHNILKLPFAALRESDEGFEVALIESGQLHYRPIEIGLEGDTHVELISSFAEGVKVVRLDGDILEAGALVTEGETP
ncbi:MAG: efflux RND transporter periplasmic adaptor subunit [Candidatus Thiodiazotropha sp. (ex Lucinoma borealis)]|nr:efflux RND transporter periplasmic adaptor subunit [Candidatus Thiodiazotropha sp. (ex Lucinoma borealis)]